MLYDFTTWCIHIPTEIVSLKMKGDNRQTRHL